MHQTLEEREIRRLLRIRKSLKRKFRRYMSWRWTKLDESWRYPRGRDNKARLQLKGKPPLVKIGYRSPRAIRHMHPSGRWEVLVRRVEDLYNVDPLTQVVRIAANVGGRKRLEIVRFAERVGIRVLNPGKLPEIAPEEMPTAAPAELEMLAREIEETAQPEEKAETVPEESLEASLEAIEEEMAAEEGEQNIVGKKEGEEGMGRIEETEKMESPESIEESMRALEKELLEENREE